MHARETVDWNSPVDVLDVVTMGLYRQIRWFRPVRQADRDLRWMLCAVGIADFAHRQIDNCRAAAAANVLARALVQDATCI